MPDSTQPRGKGTEVESSGWWACADGDEFPSRADAIAHLQMTDVNDTGKGLLREILWGPWETVDLATARAEHGTQGDDQR